MCGIYVARSAASCHTFAANGISCTPPRHFLVDYILFAPFLSFRRPPAAQVLERALFQPRNITAADVQRLRRLLPGLGRTVKSIPLPHNSEFPGRQSVHQRTQPGGVGAALAAGLHVGFIGQGVRQRQLPVRLERLLQRQRHSRPPPPPQIHAEFILNTSARIAGKALAFGGVEGIHRLDKPNRADEIMSSCALFPA